MFLEVFRFLNRKREKYPVGKTLQALLPSVFKQIQKGRNSKISEIKKVWTVLIGEKFAKMTTIERFENGILYVKVLSASLMQNLCMQKSNLMSNLIGRIKGLKIQNIIFKR